MSLSGLNQVQFVFNTDIIIIIIIIIIGSIVNKWVSE